MVRPSVVPYNNYPPVVQSDGIILWLGRPLFKAMVSFIKALLLFILMENKKKTSDYSQGKIYKIVCNKTGLIYIGSTYRSLQQRLKEHEYDSKRYLDKKCNKFVSSIYVIFNNDYRIELIENYPCSSKDDLKIKEYYYISNIDCVNTVGYLCDPNKQHYFTYFMNKKQHLYTQVEMIRDKLGDDAIKILFRYGIDEYINNNKK
jgi:hypothetical protein